MGCGDKRREDVYWEQYQKTLHLLGELRSRRVPEQTVPLADYGLVRDFLVALPEKWGTYPRILRNRLLKLIVDRVDIRWEGQMVEATIHWKTGQSEVVHIRRPRAKGIRESHWTEEEKDILTMLWPSDSPDMILAALPGRTWKAIANQSSRQGLPRAVRSSNHVSRRRWDPDQDHNAKRLYETGTPVPDIASRLGRSHSAILQRAWESGWQRPVSDRGVAVRGLCDAKQNPKVVNGVTSVPVFGGQVRW